MLVGDIVTSNARLFPKKRAIVDERTRLTWEEFNERVNRLANAMLGLGLTKGDRVAIICENCHEYAEFLFAVAKAGLTSLCLNYRFTPAQLTRIMNACEPQAAFLQDKFMGLLPSIASSVRSIDSIIGIGDHHGCTYDYESLLAKYPLSEPVVDIKEDDTFRLQYTTGTTGTSKGAILTHKNEISSCMMRIQATPTFRDDVVLEWAPLFGAGNQARLFGACFLGCTVVLTTFSAQGFVEMIEREKVTYSALLPATTFKMVRDYLEKSNYKYDLSSLRKLQAGGGQRCSGAEYKEMLDYFHIPYTNTSKAYGLTESSGPAIYLVPEDIAAGLRPGASDKERQRLDSIGKPLLNGQVRIVDDNDRDVPVGQVGEIVLKGDQIMKGYWNNPELTNKVLRGGWLHTSDLGTLDDDGYVYFEGRKDFVIKSGGLLVGPEEVEDVILQHPAIAEAAAIGIHDAKWGEVVTAVVCLKPENKVTEEEIREHCRKHLASFQVPKTVIFAESLPRDVAYGKIDRRALISMHSHAK